MLDPEYATIPIEQVQSTVSAHRRLQNRVAQRKFRERKAKKTKAIEREVAQPSNCLHTGLEFATGVHPNDNIGDDGGLPQGELPTLGYSTSLNFPAFESSDIPTNIAVDQESVSEWCPPTSSAMKLPSVPSFVDVYSNALLPGIHLDSSPWSVDVHSRQNEPDYTPSAITTKIPQSASLSATEPATHTVSFDPHRTASLAPQLSSQDASSRSLLDRHFDTITHKDTAPLLPSPLLHVAARSRNRAVINVLLRRGAATINDRDPEGRTALHIAAELGDEALVGLLLGKGADPKVQDLHGRPALYLAVENGHCEVVEMLLDTAEL